MALGKEKIKDFFEEKTEKVANKIEKTPMEKFFVFFLVLITISAFVLGYLQFKNSVEGPLLPSYLDQEVGKMRYKYLLEAGNLLNEENSEEIKKLQNQDSDLDGLDDYSEIYIYNTSAYLEDSDNDSISDKQEILSGSNPNCHEGQDCTLYEKQTNINSNNNFNKISNQGLLNISPGLEKNLEDFLDLQDQLLSGEVTLEELGINNPELEAKLKEIRNLEALDLSQLTPEEQQEIIDSIKKLTPQEIRQDLITKGFTKEKLDQIDDQTLQNLFLEVLESYQ